MLPEAASTAVPEPANTNCSLEATRGSRSKGGWTRNKLVSALASVSSPTDHVFGHWLALNLQKALKITMYHLNHMNTLHEKELVKICLRY